MALATSFVVAQPIKKYVVGVENIEYLPFYDGSGVNGSSYDGFSRSLLEMFAKHHNLQFEFYTLPIPRLYKEFVEHQHVDFKYPDNPNWNTSYKNKYQNDIKYSQPSIVPHTGIASLKQNIALNECENIGKVRGFTLQGFKSLVERPSVKVLESENVVEMIYLLYKERVDCIYISHNVLKYNINEFFDVKVPVYFQHQLPVGKQAYLLSTINHPKILAKFDVFLKNNQKKINLLKLKHQIIIE